MIRSIISTLLISLLLISPVYASGCKTSKAVEKDGYIVSDQTEVQKENMLIAHALSVLIAVGSGIKLIGISCALPAPSYYLYHGANVLEGINVLSGIGGQKDASTLKLEAYVGEKANIEEQIEALRAAEKVTMDAYDAAKKRAESAELAATLRQAAVGAAIVEQIITSVSLGSTQFVCAPRPDSFIAQSATLTSIANGTVIAAGVAETGLAFATGGASKGLLRMFANVIANFILQKIAEDAIGDSFPATRIVYYGVNVLLASDLASDYNESAQCLQQRAMEYGNLANSLTQRLSTVDIAGIETTSEGDDTGTNSDTLDTSNNNNGSNPADTAQTGSCAVQSGQAIEADPSCSNPFTPTTSSFDGFATQFSIPSGLVAGVNTANQALQAGFAGNIAKARGLAGGIGSSAFSKKKLDDLKRIANTERAKQGLPTIDFDAESRKVADQIIGATRAALRQNGITSIEDFNKVVRGEIKPTLAKAAPTTKADKEETSASNKSKNAFARFKGFDDSSNLQGNNLDLENIEQSNQAQGLEELFASGAGISGKTEDLFKIISIRHMKSAYPVFLKRAPQQENKDGIK